MALLSTHLRVRPGLIHTIVELVLVAKRPLEGSRIEALLRPPHGVAQGDDFGGASSESGRPTTTPVQDALRISVALGLLAESHEGMIPTDAIADLNPAQLHRDLRPVIRTRMLSEKQEDSDSDGNLWHDLLESVSWLLAQEMVWMTNKSSHEWFNSRHFKQVTSTKQDKNLYNETKKLVLIDWGKYLGVLATDPVRSDQIVADPTCAVRWALASCLQGSSPVIDVLDELRRRLCVLDQGTARSAMLKWIDSEELPWEREPRQISPSLSLALYRLDREGFVKLLAMADTPEERRRTLTLKDNEIRSGGLIDAIDQGTSFARARRS